MLPFKSKYEIRINRREEVGIKKLKNSKAFHSQTIGDVHENLEDYNPTKKRMEANKKLNPIASELFLRGRNPSISLIFISQSYFKVPKTIKVNATHYFIMKKQTKENFNR